MPFLAFYFLDAVAFRMAHFGAGIGAIHLDNVGCTGNEGRVIDCSRGVWFHCASGHFKDAGVRCQSGGLLMCLIKKKAIKYK